jgi:glyoxylase-like metal-dependent hydrolase (beta-lactamase superfamily II)
VSTPWTFSTNSFVIEGPTGLILVDLQFTPGQAERLVTEAERASRKKTELAVVLHANPDKFNGSETLQKRGVRVVTSSQVKALIAAVFKQRTEAFSSRYAPDWPTVTPSPESFGDRTTEINAGGTKVRLHVLGPGCSEAHVALEWDGADGKHVFVGDLVASKNHSWLEIGKTDEWLARIAELRALHPLHVHPGRGPSGGAELLDAEASYIRDVVRIVDEEKPTLPIPDGAIDKAKAEVIARYPGYGFEVFLDIGLPAVWEREAKRSSSARSK